MVTDDVSSATRSKLSTLFDQILPVPTLSGVSIRNLEIIGRPDLHTTLTKLNLWSLVQFSRVLYLDADTLVLASLDHLFALPSSIEFAASPELGFPDCFNSGFMLLRPDADVFAELRREAATTESFDGGDQGLLNAFWGDGTRSLSPSGMEARPETRSWWRLSFTYNMEMHKVYRFYMPAVLRYRNEHKVLHFIGKEKPWHFDRGVVTLPGDAQAYDKFYAEMVARWWKVHNSIEVAI